MKFNKKKIGLPEANAHIAVDFPAPSIPKTQIRIFLNLFYFNKKLIQNFNLIVVFKLFRYMPLQEWKLKINLKKATKKLFT